MRLILAGLAVLSLMWMLLIVPALAASGGAPAVPPALATPAPTPAPYGIAAPTQIIVVSTVAQCTQVLHESSDLCYAHIVTQHSAYVSWSWQQTPCGSAANCLNVQFFYISYTLGSPITLSTNANYRSAWFTWSGNGSPCVHVTALARGGPLFTLYRAKSENLCITNLSPVIQHL